MDPIFWAVVILAGGYVLYSVMGKSNIAGGNSNCAQPPAPSSAIAAFAAAIAVAEGSNPDWNNPGDLTASFGYSTSGPVNSAGVLQFDNCEDGWQALYAQLSAIVRGGSRYTLNDTIASFGIGYSGGDPNWAKNVANALGVDPNTQLSEVLS